MKKIAALLLVSALIASPIFSQTVSASEGGLGSRLDATGLNAKLTFFIVKRGIYAIWSLHLGREDLGYFLDNFQNLILMNPDVAGSEISGPMGVIIRIIEPLYAMGIGVSAFYLILISGTPSGRAKAKSLIMNLTTGMVLVSLSPPIAQAFIGFSAQTTSAILGTVDVGIVTQNIDNTFGGPSLPPTCPLCILHAFMTFVEIELGYFTFLPFLLAVWGTFIFFILRFIAVTLFTIVFPLGIFLYSFSATKDLGRNLLEEFILWVLLQEFNAAVAVAIALCLIQKPAGFMSVDLEIPNMEAILGSANGAAGIGTGLVLFEFIPFIGCFILVIAPFLMMRLFRNYLP